MAFARNLDFYTQGITVSAPLRCRSFDGVIADLWTAEGRQGAGGYYLSPNPRIVIFFDDVGHSIRMTNDRRALVEDDRPMGRAVYIPPGLPMWSRFTSPHAFRHLDLYMDARLVLKMLTPRLGLAAAKAALAEPVEFERPDHITQLANLLAQEVIAPHRHPLYAESLIQAIVTGMLALPVGTDDPQAGLTPTQMRRLRDHVHANIDRRLGNAELAAVLQLSESWFAHVFKQATGETPQRWQTRERVDLARTILGRDDISLCDVAHMLGFADQAHLTRVFRETTGMTPAVWRRQQLGG